LLPIESAKWIRPILTPSNTLFLEPTRVSTQTATRAVHLFLYSSPVCTTHGHTDAQTTLRVTSVAIDSIACDAA